MATKRRSNESRPYAERCTWGVNSPGWDAEILEALAALPKPKPQDLSAPRELWSVLPEVTVSGADKQNERKRSFRIR